MPPDCDHSALLRQGQRAWARQRRDGDSGEICEGEW